jgi:hypothetical protein
MVGYSDDFDVYKLQKKKYKVPTDFFNGRAMENFTEVFISFFFVYICKTA